MHRRNYADFVLAIALIGFSAACSTPAAPAPASQSASPMPHMVHDAQHGGQLGMGQEVHIEIVSARPAE